MTNSKISRFTLTLTTVMFTAIAVLSTAHAACPLDHIVIGINPDSVPGTDDDNKLFAGCLQKYRRTGTPSYKNWYYSLTDNGGPFDYPCRIGEPGFDCYQNTNSQAPYTYDPNRYIPGEPKIDYDIYVECIDISPGLRGVYSEIYQYSFTIDATGQEFNYSFFQALNPGAHTEHMHFSYQGQTETQLYWITWRLYDALGTFQSSEPFTIVFNVQPLSGDLVVDGFVGPADLAEFAYYWLGTDGSKDNDFYERADTDRDGNVNIIDLANISANWLEQIQ